MTQADLAGAQIKPMRTFPEVIAATTSGAADYAFLAVENSIEGTVGVTQDALIFDTDLLIQREVVLPVHLNLMAAPGVKLSDITTVWSFPHALAQCRKFLNEKLPSAITEPSNSTADAARQVAEKMKDDAKHFAAIAPARAAELYGLEIVASAIEDFDGNETRFVLVGHRDIPKPTGHDKTSIVVFQQADEPGSLLAILQEFAARGINLTKLESRPTRRGLGDYCFLIDLEGHIADEVVADALRTLMVKHAEVKFLGSYPSDSVGGQQVRAEVSTAIAAADAWISDLRGRIG